MSSIVLDTRSKVKPIEIIEALEKENIESRPVWKPMHLEPVFKDYDFIQVEEESIAKKLFENGVCLPSDTKMTNEEQDVVINKIKSLF